MIEPFADPAVVQRSSDAATAIMTSLGASGGGTAVLWFILRGMMEKKVETHMDSKLESIKTLWAKFDGFKDEVSANRLADAKEYATRAELTRIIEKLEAHFDKRFDDLERKLDNRGKT